MTKTGAAATKGIFDPNAEARRILCAHTEDYMSGIKVEYEDNEDMMSDMYEQCAAILTNYLLEGKYSPMEYAKVRFALGELIWSIFEGHIEAENEEDGVFFASIMIAVT